MTNFIEPDDSSISLDLLYSNLGRYGSSFISILDELLPNSIKKLNPLHDAERLRIDFILYNIIKNYKRSSPGDEFIIFFILNPDVLELCGEEFIENLWKKVDWDKITSSTDFYNSIKNNSGFCLSIYSLLISKESKHFFNYLKQLPYSEKISILHAIDEASSIVPMFSKSFLLSLEEKSTKLIDFEVNNFWIFSLDKNLQTSILMMAQQNSEIVNIKFSSQTHTSKLHHLFLPYCTNKYSSILELMYENYSLIEIIEDLHNFICGNNDLDWFDLDNDIVLNISLPSENKKTLPVPDFNDTFNSIQDFIHNVEYTILSYLLKRFQTAERNEVHDILLQSFNNDYIIWNAIEDLYSLSGETKLLQNNLILFLISTTSETEFVNQLNNTIKYLNFDFSQHFNPPGTYHSFLENLLISLTDSFNPQHITLFSYFLNVLYSGHVSINTDSIWTSKKNIQLVSKYLIKVLSTSDPKIILSVFNLHRNLIPNFDINDKLLWSEWIIHTIYSQFPIQFETKQNIQFVTFLHSFENLSTNDTKILLLGKLVKFKDPICNYLFTLLTEQFESNPDCQLNKTIAYTLLVNEYQPFFDFLKHTYNNRQYNKNNILIISLILKKEDYTPQAFIAELNKLNSFQFISQEFLKELSLNAIDFIPLIVSEIKLNKKSLKDFSNWFSNLKAFFYDQNEVNAVNSHIRYESSLNKYGIILLEELSILHQSENNDRLYILILHAINDLLSPIDNFDFLKRPELNILRSFCNDNLIQLRKIVRGLDIMPDKENYITVFYNSGLILSYIDGRIKTLKQLLATFRHIPEATLSSNLEPYTSTNISIYSKITLLIHVLLDRTNLEDEFQLRRELTEFFVKKLKPLKTSDSKRSIVAIPDYIGDNWDGWSTEYIEPDPVWRYAYIRAIKDLGIHSRGKKQYYAPLMKKVAESDPSTKVKKVAAETATLLNNLRTGLAKGSSKRRLLQAWWWIRQAHMITLNGFIDPKGAERIRVTEVR